MIGPRRQVVAAFAAVILTGCGSLAGQPDTHTPPAATFHAIATPSLATADKALHSAPFDGRFRASISHRPGDVSAAVLELGTNRLFVYRPNLSGYMASTVKVPILITALLRANRLREPMTADGRGTAESMIEHSDNYSATKIWRMAGGNSALHHLFAGLGMSHTNIAPVLLEPWDGWTTRTTDQVHLLRAIVARLAGLSASETHWLLSLMGSVEADQTWGIFSGLPPSARVAVKNGWVPVPGHGWTVESMGLIQIGQHIYCESVLSVDQPDLAAGISTVEAAASAMNKVIAARSHG